MTVEVKRRGMIRHITDLPETADPIGGYVELEQGGAFYKCSQGILGGGDPALQPTGTELAQYSSEFASDPGFTWLNQGTSTVDYALRRAIIVPQSGGAGTNNLRLLGPTTFPAAPWCVRTRFFNYSPISGQGGGFAIYRASNGRIHTPNLYLPGDLNGGGGVTLAINDWSNFTTINATRKGPTLYNHNWLSFFVQVRCDGVNMMFDISPDNARFTFISQTSLATYLGGTGTDLRVLLVGNDPTTGAAGAAQVGYNWFRVYGNANINQ